MIRSRRRSFILPGSQNLADGAFGGAFDGAYLIFHLFHELGVFKDHPLELEYPSRRFVQFRSYLHLKLFQLCPGRMKRFPQAGDLFVRRCGFMRRY